MRHLGIMRNVAVATFLPAFAVFEMLAGFIVETDGSPVSVKTVSSPSVSTPSVSAAAMVRKIIFMGVLFYLFTPGRAVVCRRG